MVTGKALPSEAVEEEEPSAMCSQTGHTYSQVYLFKQAVCTAQTEYQKVSSLHVGTDLEKKKTVERGM